MGIRPYSIMDVDKVRNMSWKNLEDIKIICKKCNKVMILESTLNDTNGIYVCSNCNEHINLVCSGNKGVRDIGIPKPRVPIYRPKYFNIPNITVRYPPKQKQELKGKGELDECKER